MSDSSSNLGLPKLSDRARARLGTATPSQPLAPAKPRCPECPGFLLTLSEALKQAQEGTLRMGGDNDPVPTIEQIARWLRAPTLPAEKPRRRRDIWGGTFFAAIACVVVILTGLMVTAILGPIIGIPATLITLVIVLGSTRKNTSSMVPTRTEHEAAMVRHAWERRMEIWERIRICPQCGMAHDVAVGRSVPWYAIPDLYLPSDESGA